MEREALNRLILASEYLIDGRSLAWVAREFGYTGPQTSLIAGFLGLSGKRQSPSPKNLDKYDQVEQAILEEWPIGEIEKTFNISRDVVDRWFPDRRKMSAVESGELAQLYKENREARKRARERGSWSDLIDRGEE